ncbi:MAG: peptidoglycan DD-metalloendopeptidase family protein [Paenibacillaceae bacterium]
MKKIIVPILAAILLISTFNAAPEHGQAATKLDQLEKKIKQIEAKERAAQRAIKNNENVIQSLDVKKDKTKNEMNYLLNAIQTKLALIGEKEKEIAATINTLKQTTIELDEAEQRVVLRDDLLRARLRLMYTNGAVSYLEVLFNATSFSDFLDRYQSLSMIVDQDQEILTSNIRDKELIALNKTSIEKNLEKLNTLYASLEKDKNELQLKEHSKEVMIAQLEDSKEDLIEINEEQEKALIDIATAKSQAKKERDAEAKRVVATQKGKFAWPLPDRFTISSPFGNRIHPISHKKKMHTGTDIAAPKGTKIMAAGNGEVIVAKYYGGYGNCVIIDHNGKWTIYGHMSKISVKEGQQVKTGQKLGEVGSTGDSTGNHLHYEVRINSVAVDPMKYTFRP